MTGRPFASDLVGTEGQVDLGNLHLRCADNYRDLANGFDRSTPDAVRVRHTAANAASVRACAR